MILLSDEELEGLDYSHEGKFKSSHEVDLWVKQVVAKAQSKKVVEELGAFNDKPVGEEVRFFIDRFRQSLLEEL